MAIVETGLGWYADSSWLTNLATNIGEVTGGGGGGSSSLNSWTFDSPNQPISVLSNPRYPDGTYAYMQSNNYGPGYVSCASGAVYCFVVISNNNRSVYFASLINGVTCYSVFNDNTRWNAYTNTYHAASGFYYGSYTGSRATTNPNDYEIPAFTSLDIALLELSGIGTTATFSKSAPGYSVVCMCKWKTSLGGSVYCSPILISSEVANTYFSQDGSVVSVPSTTHTFYGMTFHMRKFTDLTLHGSETVTSNFPVLDYSESPPLSDNPLFALIASASSLGVGYPPQSDDPYADGGTSGPEAGTPHFDEESEFISPDVEFPSSFSSTGFCRVYAPTAGELQALSDYMWTDQTFIDTFVNSIKNHFENMMESIISLTLVPCVPNKGTAIPVKVMYINTNVSMAPVTSQFKIVNCGTVRIDERYGSALDYNPYTKVSVYLPFIGTVPLDTDEVMGRTIRCEYTIDVLTGNCVAKITILTNTGDVSETADRGCFYEFSGNCAISMPFNSGDFTNYFAAAMTGLKTVAGLIATGSGAPNVGAALLGEPTAHPSTTKVTTTARNPSTGRQITTGTETTERIPAGASFKELAVKGTMNTVSSVANSKFIVEHGSGFSGNSGFMSVTRPFVIITRPNMCNPDNYGSYNGRPCMMYLNLGTLHGYTQVQNIHLTGFSATNPELGEISELLKSGVIL